MNLQSDLFTLFLPFLGVTDSESLYLAIFQNPLNVDY